MSYLLYDSPARFWMEALPLGNGSLGAMCYSGTATDIISLNHDTLWTGIPRNPSEPGACAAYSEAKKLVRKGEYKKAQDLIESRFLSRRCQAYMPFGNLVLNFPEAEYSDYQRRLDLSTAILESSFKTNGGQLRKTTFVSNPHQVLVSYIEGEELNFDITITSPLKSDVYCRDGILIVDGECPGDFDREGKNGKGLIYSSGDEARGVQFRGALKVITNGEVNFFEGSIAIRKAASALLLFTIATSFDSFQKHPFTEGREYRQRALNDLEAASKLSFDELMKAHTDDYKSYFDRVNLSIAGNRNENLTTDKRIDNFRFNNDMGLYELLFDFGRYLLIASSRKGTQATNLQGIWNNSTSPPWHSNYTTNINTEMNYWPVLPCAMPELMEPLHTLINALSFTGEETARNFYGAGGFTAHHNADLWGNTVPAPGSASWGYWCGASGWLCRSLFEEYEYSGDKVFLKETALPIMKKAARFYLDILSRDREEYLVISPATSPENIFIKNGEKVAVAESTTMMNSIVLDLLTCCRKAMEDLQDRDEIYTEICNAIPEIRPLAIGENGAILEWNEPLEETEVHHRHVSHLYALHPAGLITKEKTPELFEAARRTLEVRGDDGTGWSLAWKINFWARLLDGDHALKLLKKLITPVGPDDTTTNYSGGGGLYPNMFDAHPPFQIDGNFGAVSGICEMLLQSDGRNLWLLPALPAEWPSGSVRGLAAKGGVKVDITWREGAITEYSVTPENHSLNIHLCR